MTNLDSILQSRYITWPKNVHTVKAMIFPTSLVTQTVESTCSTGDPGLIPGLGRSPGEGNGNPLQYTCLENSMDGGGWWATVHGVAKSWARLTHSLVPLAEWAQKQ